MALFPGNNYSQDYATTVSFNKALKSLFRLFRVLLDLQKSILSGAIKFCICLVTLGKLEAFRNFEIFNIIFPKILDAI